MAAFDPDFGTALDAAAAIRAKQISSVELTQHTWRRIDAFEPKLNAYVYQLREAALAAAARADEATARGAATGPLHGVPINVKESFGVEGRPCTWGIPFLKNSKAPAHSVAVRRLLDAGAILLGATNVPLELMDYESFNDIYGTSNNPWDLARTPGGSSGGTAASLAAGTAFFSIGSDIGGSIRAPASFCGIYGHKPTLASGLANAEILTAVACCNLTTRSVFHRLYEKEERRLDEATGRITDLERELTRGGEEKASEEFRRFRESRIRYDRQATERNLRAQHIHELKHAISEVLEKFDISGLEAEDIDEALELVEEVEGEEHEAAFWKPPMDRLLGAVELYDDGQGPVRTDISGLSHLKLETWELLAARKTVAAGGEPPSERDRTVLQAAILRVKAEQEREALAAAGAASPDLLRAARATLARASQVDARLTALIEESQIGPAEPGTRSWTRTRFRLLGAASALWLALDEVETRRPAEPDA